jgi:transposase-like protein
MKKVTTLRTQRESSSNTANTAPAAFEPLGPDLLAEALRGRIRGAIQSIIDEELSKCLGAGSYERTGKRLGYRHGTEQRKLSTSLGPVELEVPRARLRERDGSTKEWRSQMLPRYSRRARSVDNAILGAYLAGANTRKLRGALRPLLRGTPLSKSAISRVVTRLKGEFEDWKQRPLDDEDCVYLYLDGFGVKVRTGGRLSRMTVLAIVGVKADGTKVLLALDMAGSEAEEAWKPMLEGLVARGLGAPKLCIIDGCAGLANAIAAVWGGAEVQRCAVHKLRNLIAKAPDHAVDAIRDDFHDIVYAKNEAEARKAYARFLSRWKGKCQKVVESLEEAGEQLLTFYRFPASQWKALRTTNVIERLNEEFRRRIKTQSSLPAEDSALVLLFSLVASGHVRLRRIDGWQDIIQTKQPTLQSAA